ncbi:MAG: HD family hydrolase [Candidatus Nanohaloarchaea archaeon]
MSSIDFLLDVLELKSEERAWIDIFEVEKGESVAGHSWSTAFLTLFYGRELDIDLEKALKIAIVHDIAEAEIGDIANRVDEENRDISLEKKHRMEEEVWEDWRNHLGDDIFDMWQDFEERDSKEAKFVKDMDLIDLCLQALKVEKQGIYPDKLDSEFENLDEVFKNSRMRLKTDFGEKIMDKVERRYERSK